MAKLIFNYYDYMGYYNFVADIEGQTKITSFTKALNHGKPNEKLIDSEQTVLKFINALEEICIEDWDCEYLSTSMDNVLTDMPHFKVCYVNEEGTIYASQGEVRLAPEGYNSLIDAISIIDPSVGDLLPTVELELEE